MSWNSYRKLADENEVNHDDREFKWESEHIPILHSGFQEMTADKKPKCRLVITLMYTRGRYVLKLTDRVSHKAAWIEDPPLENLIGWLEEQIVAGEIFWESEDPNFGNRSNFS